MSVRRHQCREQSSGPSSSLSEVPQVALRTADIHTSIGTQSLYFQPLCVQPRLNIPLPLKQPSQNRHDLRKDNFRDTRSPVRKDCDPGRQEVSEVSPAMPQPQSPTESLPQIFGCELINSWVPRSHRGQERTTQQGWRTVPGTRTGRRVGGPVPTSQTGTLNRCGRILPPSCHHRGE